MALSPWHPDTDVVVPFMMSEQTINRTESGGVVTRKKSLYASKRVLTQQQMDEGLDLLQTWARRSLPPQRKFSTTMIGHAADVKYVYDAGLPPATAIPLLEAFLVALRGPYGREHITMPNLPLWTMCREQRWANAILDMVYTLVADTGSQNLLRAQWVP